MRSAATIYDEEERPRSRVAARRAQPNQQGVPFETNDQYLSAHYVVVGGAVLAGVYATPEELQRQADIERLTTLISKFTVHGLSWDTCAAARVSLETASTAVCLIESLGLNKRLPKVAPDGEGNLILLWESDAPLLIGVDEWRLHVVFAATTPNAKYLENIPFDGTSLPDFIGRAIPTA